MARTHETDPSLRRVQRDSAIACAVFAAAALALQRGRLDGALGVVAGAGLMAVSYLAIRDGVTTLVQKTAVASEAPPGTGLPRVRLAWTVAKYVGRYAVIGAAAWAVLVPLQAHPLGLFAGVSAPVAAIGLEALRLLRAGPRPGAPRA